MRSKRFSVFWSLARSARSLRTVSSRTPLILEESIMTFLDWRRARLRLRKIFFGLLVNGDLISNSTPSSKMSAVLDVRVGKNSTVCPASDRILATRNSCGQGQSPAGMIICALLFLGISISYLAPYYHARQNSGLSFLCATTHCAYWSYIGKSIEISARHGMMVFRCFHINSFYY